ncbi:MAG: acetyltransferase [Bacteroidetes bacterium]|nr:MAG: acetyltransferase [Bacteroidota bacterium]
MNKPIIILGAGSIGKSAMEAFASNEVIVYGFLDDDALLEGKEIGDVEVMGKLDDQTYLSVIGNECEAFVAMEEIEVRRNLVQMLVEDRKVMPVNAIHDSAILATSAEIGHGNFIGAGVIIGSYSELKNHLIINPAAVINHEVKLGNYVQIGAGSVINSGVEIEDEVFVGSGVTIVSGIKIGSGARIGAGSVVIKKVDEGQTVFGNPAEPV